MSDEPNISDYNIGNEITRVARSVLDRIEDLDRDALIDHLENIAELGRQAAKKLEAK